MNNNNYKKQSKKRDGYILHTIFGNIDAEILTSKTAQVIIKILTSRKTFEILRAKSALLEFNQQCIERNSNIKQNRRNAKEGKKYNEKE